MHSTHRMWCPAVLSSGANRNGQAVPLRRYGVRGTAAGHCTSITKTAKEEAELRAIATRKQPVYTASGAVESGRYIDKNDRCEVGGITQNLLIPITYPAGGGTRQAYVRSLEGFIQG